MSVKGADGPLDSAHRTIDNILKHLPVVFTVSVGLELIPSLLLNEAIGGCLILLGLHCLEEPFKAIKLWTKLG